MPDREKVIKGLEILMNGCEYIQCEDCCFYISTKPFRCGLREEQIQEDALALLKEQEDLGTELTNAVELIHKKNERIEKLLKEQEAVVHPEPSCEMTYITNCCCDLCGVQLIREDNFCRCCGKRIEWEGR